ncbi:MAG: tetratricopeptide repeat protein [Coleofasciculaceae cyanobacterium RL_1_1]|nr:tetratricopeptide repeat protein [Coleofasciculaceae cyanobacterium RL_1_1]
MGLYGGVLRFDRPFWAWLHALPSPRSPWISKRDFELYSGVVEAAYVFHDMMLGTMMDLVGDETTIVLVSDHGFHPDRLRPKHVPNEPAGPAEEHRPFGIFAMKGPNIAKDKVIFGANLLDVTPTLLAALGLPLGRDMDGKPLLGVFETPPEITWIDSWDDVPGDSGMHPAGMRVDTVDAHAAMQQLVDLGYIEELDTDRETAVANTARELRYNLARDYIGAGQPVNAIPILQDLWAEWPDESRFGIKLFNCLLALDRVAEARSTFEQIIVNKEKYSEIARVELERFNAEIEHMKAENPDFKLDKSGRRRRKKLRARSLLNRPTLEYLRGLLLHAEGQNEAAITAFNKARDTQLHNRPSLLLRQAEVYLSQRQWLEAESLYSTVLQLDPVNPSAHVGLCQCFLRQQRNEDAIEAGLAALSLISDHPLAHFYTGVALMRCERYDEAKIALEAAIGRNPLMPLAHRYLAQLYRKQFNDQKTAKRHRKLAKKAHQQLKQIQQNSEFEPQDTAIVAVDLDAIPPIAERSGAADIPLENCINIVSGLPRSGTSMMMQMLAKGGLDVFTDGVREADMNNPRGYYEFELVKNLGRDNSWIDRAQGSVVKIVAPLLPKLPRDRAYRIVFMQRPLSETIASQQKMLERSDRQGGKLTPDRLAATFLQQVATINALLADYPQVSVLAVNYHDAIHDRSAQPSAYRTFSMVSLMSTPPLQRSIRTCIANAKMRQTSARSRC